MNIIHIKERLYFRLLTLEDKRKILLQYLCKFDVYGLLFTGSQAALIDVKYIYNQPIDERIFTKNYSG